jgi:hypothetical protein
LPIFAFSTSIAVRIWAAEALHGASRSARRTERCGMRRRIRPRQRSCRDYGRNSVSNVAGPELEALTELRSVLHALTEELASWRRRALKAEAQQIEFAGGHDVVASRERIVALEAENADLHGRVEAARGRVSELAQRLRFLEQQVALEEQVP